MPIAPETREALHFPLLQENTSVGTAGRELRKKKEELLMTANESVF
jgi:hypothetical protein